VFPVKSFYVQLNSICPISAKRFLCKIKILRNSRILLSHEAQCLSNMLHRGYVGEKKGLFCFLKDIFATK
jgi:hypothetical protein